MSIHLIDYTGDPVPTGAPVETPMQAAWSVVNGFIPDNLLRFSNLSDSFRDATIADLLMLASAENKFEDVLATLTAAVRSAREDSVSLRIYSEYAASIAFAWEHQELAARIIMRNSPQNTSPFLWSIVAAIKKNMPSAMYASFAMSQGEPALTKWREEAVTQFGLTYASQGMSAPASSNPTV